MTFLQALRQATLIAAGVATGVAVAASIAAHVAARIALRRHWVAEDPPADTIPLDQLGADEAPPP